MRNIVIEKIINKDTKFLYDKWTTKDGLNSFFSKDNDIEITYLGKYEIYFSLDTSNKARGSEGCIVLSSIPNKMLSFTWNTPPSFPDLRNSNVFTIVIIEFIEIEKNITKIRLSNIGYPEDEIWNKAYEYFLNAWEYVLNNLVKKCN